MMNNAPSMRNFDYGAVSGNSIVNRLNAYTAEGNRDPFVSFSRGSPPQGMSVVENNVKSENAANPSFVSRIYPGGIYDADQYLQSQGRPPAKKRLMYRTRQGVTNWVMALTALIVPIVIFTAVMCCTSLSVHYTSQNTVFAIDVLCGLVVLVFGGLAIMTKSKGKNPVWFIVVCLFSALALCAAVSLGDWVYSSWTRGYYDVIALNKYQDVDPSVMIGNQLMDAGQVQFVEEAAPDVGRTMGFQSYHMYCVAPITVLYNEKPNQRLDFWAVGKDCCGGGSSGDFSCGDMDAGAHYGIRLLHEDDRNYYRLAVEQASIAFGLPVQHSVFFEWTKDVDGTLSAFISDGNKHVFLSIVFFAVFQLVCVATTLFILSKT